MRRPMVLQLAFALSLLALLWLAANSTGKTTAAQATHAATSIASSFDQSPIMTVGQAITDNVSDDLALHTYKFNAQVGTRYSIALTATSGNYLTSLSVVSSDMMIVLAESDGADLIDSSLHFVAPQNAVYGVVVSYSAATFGTPVPGAYRILLSQALPATP